MLHVDARRPRAILDRTTIAAFLVAIAAPTVDTFVRSDDVRGPAPELRTAAPLPAFPTDAASLQKYPEAYELHFNDTFGLRDQLLRGNALVKIFGLGVSPTDSGIVGKNGWLFFAGDGSIDTFRGLLPFREGELEAWRRALEGRRDWLAAQGIRYLYVIAPNKESIYPELMPSCLNRVGPTRLDELADYLRTHSDVEFLDLRPALWRAKQVDVGDDFTYTPLGTHWSGRGAYVSYYEIARRLTRWFPELHPWEWSELECETVPGQGDTWAARMYIGDFIPQRITYCKPRARTPVDRCEEVGSGPMRERWVERHDPKLPRALLFHDSFGNYVQDFLADHFSSLVEAWRADFDREIIAVARPDVVIEQYVERVLVAKPPLTLPTKFERREGLAFQRSHDVRWKLAFPAVGGALEPRGNTRLVETPGPVGTSGPCLAIERESKADLVQLPEFDTQNARELVLYARIDVPAVTALTVLYKRPGDTEYLHRNRWQVLLRTGENRVYVAMDPKAYEGRLVLLTGSALTGTTLCELEVRAVD